MLSGGKRVAYTRVQAAHVIYSQVEWEKGRNSGKVQSVFLRVSKSMTGLCLTIMIDCFHFNLGTYCKCVKRLISLNIYVSAIFHKIHWKGLIILILFKHFIFLKLPGKRGDGPKGWAIQAKLDVLIWLGLHKHKKDYLKDAPKGFQMVNNVKPYYCSSIQLYPFA